jgi:hypothetical protein
MTKLIKSLQSILKDPETPKRVKKVFARQLKELARFNKDKKCQKKN